MHSWTVRTSRSELLLCISESQRNIYYFLYLQLKLCFLIKGLYLYSNLTFYTQDQIEITLTLYTQDQIEITLFSCDSIFSRAAPLNAARIWYLFIVVGLAVSGHLPSDMSDSESPQGQLRHGNDGSCCRFKRLVQKSRT